MADAEFRIRAVMDINDVVSNVGAIQKSFSKLKLPDNLKDSISKNIGSFYKEYEKYQKKISEGIKTQGDFNQVEKSLIRLKNLYENIGQDVTKAAKIDPKALIDLDSGEFKRIANEIEAVIKKLSDIKVDEKAFTNPIRQIESLTKSKKIVGDDGIINRLMGEVNKGNIEEAKRAYAELQTYAEKVAPRKVFNKEGREIAAPGTYTDVNKYKQLQDAVAALGVALGKAGADAAPLEAELNRLQKELDETVAAAGQDLLGKATDFNKERQEVEKVTDSLKRMHEEEYSFNRQAQDIDRQIQSYFGLSQMIRKVGDIARDAFNTVKELDAAMVETAVVTNFSVGDMWDMLPTYTENANQLGSTIKDVYEAATLYYQQGLNQAQSMGLANETLKMARIGGLQAAEATNMMTAALRGFNMEINQVSAKRINDVYSELAAITAADTKEIGSAMERTASIANSANMEFETTSAFLAQMIETTREAPENLGTAMKTIIARFQEMKQDPTKLVDSEGVAMDVNKIDTALKTIGVDLTNARGEFRDLDDVFLDISAKWDSLTQGQQRYIATIAAGSRQQSRFIAMMQNHERVMELVDAANNSTGASQKQFEKTLDSMSSKLNKFKNAWDQFTMGLMNNQLLKGGVDILTQSFTLLNKALDFISGLSPKPLEGITQSVLTLVTTLGMLQFGKKAARGGVMAGVGWWKGDEEGIIKNFKAGSGWGMNKKDAQKEAVDFRSQAEKQLARKVNARSSKAIEVTTRVRIKTVIDTIDTTTLGPKLKEDLKNKVNALSKEIENGNITKIEAKAQFTDYAKSKGLHDNTVEKLASGFDKEVPFDKYAPKVEALSNKVQTLGNNLTTTGIALSEFGSKLGGPVGAALTSVGSIMTTFGTTIQSIGIAIADNYKAILLDAEGKVVDAEATAGLSVVQTAATSTSKALGKALWTSLGPLVVIVAAIGAAVAAYKLLDAAIVTNKEKLEATTDAAAKASEAFDSAKQETSELQDSIARIRETDNAFDNLVAGTADFNEQLVTANEQITALINKYPMLMEGGYVSTDKNGLMHITEEGLKEVEKYQKQIQAQASAANIIQAADLAALENQQKANRLRSKTWNLSADEIQKNRQEANLLDQRAEAEKEVARRNAIRTILNNQEIKDVEAISALYSDLYEQKRKAAETSISNLDDHEIRQRYADYHGYTYNQSTKKIIDTEGNEVEYDDKILKDEVIEQTVLLNFKESAGTLDGVLGDLNAKFNKVLDGNFKGSNNFISDLLSSNIETDTDLLKEVLTGSSSQLTKMVNSMSEAEIAAVLGVTEENVKSNLNTYKEEVVNLFTNQAKNIADAQFKSYSELGRMMAQSKGLDLAAASTTTMQNSIASIMREFSAEEANILSTVGQTLEENVGAEAMETFITKASDIYLTGNKKTVNGFNDILNEINFESPTSRLEGYTKAIQSNNETIKDWGQSMLNSADEANILGDAFDEFLGGEWTELSENIEDFQNSMGEIDGSGILEASKQSKTLKTLLDSGQVSASGLAKALQGVQDGSISQVNETVLKLLSSLNRLEDTALEAHNIIENFDPGIDYGESEDFMKENAEKVKEYMDNNEWGNPQLQAYIKLAAGEERWNEALRKNHGDLKKTTKALDQYATAFSDGTGKVWDSFVNKKGLNGESFEDNIANIDDKKLRKKFKEVQMEWDDNGFLQIDFGRLTTEEFELYLQKVGGLSEDYAKLMAENLANYNETESAELAKNDLKVALKNEDFRNSLRDVNGNLVFSNADIQAFKAAGGSMEELAEAAGIAKDEIIKFRVVDKEGNRLDASDGKLLKRYAETYETGKRSIKSLFSDTDFIDKRTDSFDVNKLMSSVQARGFDENQAIQSAFAAYEKAQKEGQAISYDGALLEEGLNFDEFQERIQEITDTNKWVPIGEAIAQGFMNYMSGNTSSENKKASFNPENKNLTPEEFDNMKSIAQETQTALDNITSKGDEAKQEAIEIKDAFVEANLDGLARMNSGQFNELNSQLSFTKEEIDSINKARQELFKDKNVIKYGVDNSEAMEGMEATEDEWGKTTEEISEEPMVLEADESSALAGQQAVYSSWEKIVQSGKSNPMVLGTTTQPNNEQGESSSTYEVEVKGQDKIEELQTKLTTLDNLVNKGGIYNLNISGNIDSLQKAAKAAKALSKNQGQKNISVKTEEVDTQSIDDAKKSIKRSNAKIQVGANTKPAIDAAEEAREKINKKKATIDVSINQTGSKTVTIEVKRKGKTVGTVEEGVNSAKGKNNKIPNISVPSIGSVAKGSRYGRVGPKGKGGLTLTGEKGFEIAWIPSESRSMILGANGPQMLNLPDEAVVYTHEQSKKIIKQKAIPAGSHSGLTDPNKNTTPSSPGKKPRSNSDKSHHDDDKTNKQHKKNVKNAGKLNLWWWNMTKKVEATQRRIDQLSKKIEKGLKAVGASLESIAPTVSKYLKDIRLEEKYSEQMRDYAQEKLTRLSTGTSDKKEAKIAAAREKVRKAQKRYNEKQSKENKKDLQKSKKELKRARKSGVEYSKVSYKSGKKTKKKKVNLSKFIKYDEESGAYVVDYEKINNTYKSGKLRKAVGKAATQKLEKWQGNYNTADDNFIKAQEELEQLSEDLYETFFAWENELTELWELTQKIEQTQNKISRGESFTELLDAQLKSGRIDTGDSAKLQEFTDKYNETFRTTLGLQVDKIKEQVDSIKEQQNVLDALSNGTGLQDTLEKVRNTIQSIKNEKELQESSLPEQKENINKEIEQLKSERKDLDTRIKAQKNLITETQDKRDKAEKNKKTKKVEELDGQLDGLVEILKQLELEAVQKDYNGQINSKKDELEKLDTDFKAFQDEYETKILANEQYEKELEDKIALFERARAYMNPVQNADGTIDFNFDQEAFEKDRIAGNISNEDYDKMKKVIDDLLSNTNNLEDLIANLNGSLADLYNSLADLNSQWADYSTDLLSYYEDVQQAEIDRLRSLSESINNTLKNLLDKVKKNLDERRKQEDNLKTQNDISRKQQRLSALRADTSGGHQVEIAQLEKEIAESQRDYGRTLEDQQLERLQNSADEAAAQRERQISLLEGLNTAVNNAAEVNKWMNNPEAYKAEIKQAFYDEEEYNEMPWAKQKEIETKFDEFWNGLTTNRIQAVLTEAAIEQIETASSDAKDAAEAGQSVLDFATSLNTALSEQVETVLPSINAAKTAINGLKTAVDDNTKALGGTITPETPETPETPHEDSKLVQLGKDLINQGVNATLDGLKEGVSALPDAMPAILDGAAQATVEVVKGTKRILNRLFGTHFASGGLATSTGPAWLDGTPSKPELVLNPTDTKNFLALRDVLSNTMSSINSSTTSTNNSSVFEININVDHINSDYDVDKIADRVKKDIIKTAGYRNVTQVRNLR